MTIATEADAELCRRKTHFASKKKARYVASQIRKRHGKAVFAYRCPVCGRWLHTSQPQRQSDVTRAEKGQRAPLDDRKHNRIHQRRITMQPTSEQSAAVDLFGEGLNLAIEALAGTGKSSTLRMMGESTRRRGTYLAFNRAVVDDAKQSFPHNVTAMTAHGLAFRHVGKFYERRLNTARVRSYELSKRLGLTKPITLTLHNTERKVLQPGYLASSVMKAMKAFAFSDAAEPGREHIAFIDGIDLEFDGTRRKTDNNDYVAEQLLPYMRKAWADWQNTDGTLPFFHDSYVKIFERRQPKIPGEYLLLDEAQDLSPVMISIAEQQEGMQLCVIGDRFQQLYEWRGSVDAMTLMDVDARTRLSMSFRFGSAIADAANTILHWIADMPEDVALTGRPGAPGEIVAIPDADVDAILCRTNAIAIENVLRLQERHRKPHLVGGGQEVAMFARAARYLKTYGTTDFHELACFDSWLAVQAYVEDDPQGSELALMVRLVDDFGVDTILNAIDNMPPESAADVIVSTGHKAKGREWDRVQLAEDFGFEPTDEFPDDSELRLLYVAVTRAREQIDVTRCGILPHLIEASHA